MLWSEEAPAPDLSEETMKIRVERQALLAIAGNPGILNALMETSFSITIGSVSSRLLRSHNLL
jgi:hypothetical protein